jgi:outer membrane cobalamin receptor
MIADSSGGAALSPDSLRLPQPTSDTTGMAKANSSGDTIPAMPASVAAPGNSDTTVNLVAASVPSAGGAGGSDSIASAAAQEEVPTLDRMVVSATRTRRRVSETPASVSVIARQEIESSPAKDINDLIANKTSVQIRRVVGMGEGVPSDISMRGIPGAFAAARTLVLVDGIPTNASGTPFLILNEIPVDIIESIEIVRGPYSSLYGANAFGGVINVVTKKGDGKPGAAGTFETSYPFSVANAWSKGGGIRNAARDGASQALWNGDVMSSGGNARLSYLVNGGYRTIGNYLLDDSALVKASDTSYRIPANNYDYNDLRLFGKFGYRINERLTVDLHTRYFRSDLGFGYTRYSPDTIDIDITGEKFIIGPQVSCKVSDRIDLRAGGYVRRVLGSYVNEMNGKPISWESEARDWQVDLQGIMRPVDGHVLMLGAEILSNTIEFGDLINLSTDSAVGRGLTNRIRNGGAYLQDEFTLLDRLHIVPGIRLDYHTVFGIALSPKLGISAKVNDIVRVRSSLGRAFRAPNHTELFMPPLPLQGNITLVSNPNLTPEYIWAADGGVDIFPYRNLKLQAGLFYNNMRDLIGQGIKPDFSNGTSLKALVTHENISKAWSAGSELEAEWLILPGISVRGGYVFQQSRNESASKVAAWFLDRFGEDSGVKDTNISLDYIPSHKANFGFTVTRTFGTVRVSFTGEEALVGSRTYQNFGQISLTSGHYEINFDPSTQTIKANPPLMRLEPYARTDFSLRCDINTHLWVAVALQNCFNARYEESFGTFAPGRLASIRIGAGF